MEDPEARVKEDLLGISKCLHPHRGHLLLDLGRLVRVELDGRLLEGSKHLIWGMLGLNRWKDIYIFIYIYMCVCLQTYVYTYVHSFFLSFT